MCNSSENCCGSNQLTFLVVQVVVQIGVWELMIKLWGVDGSNP